MVSLINQQEIYLRNQAGNTVLKIRGRWVTKAKFEKREGKTIAMLDHNLASSSDLEVFQAKYINASKEDFMETLRKVKNHISTTYHCNI